MRCMQDYISGSKATEQVAFNWNEIDGKSFDRHKRINFARSDPFLVTHLEFCRSL